MSSTAVRGGGFIVRPRPIRYRPGNVVGLCLISDTHLGAPNVDEGMLRYDLQLARERGERVLLLGDIGNLILPQDSKRYTPSQLHPRLWGRDDVVNGTLDMAGEVFGPYADLIDLIAVGNHETALEKRGVDFTKLLIERLSQHAPRHTIYYGGYCGYVVYEFHVKGKPSQKYTIWYHHSSGKSSTWRTVYERVRTFGWSGADLMWIGHHHTAISGREQRLFVPASGDRMSSRDVRYVATGSYLVNYEGQSQDSVKVRGRQMGYAGEAGYVPTGTGGAHVSIQLGVADRDMVVSVSQ